MISGFVVKKQKLTSVYTSKGARIAVTECLALPLTVTQLKTKEKDGYQSVQVAYGQKKHLDKATLAKISHLKLKITPQYFREFFPVTEELPKVGDQISIDSVLVPGDKISVTGKSKGRGFAGVIKRHGFQRQPVTGGQSDRTRAPGAIGAQTPGKVIKGKKMPGHFGNHTATVSHLQVISIDKDNSKIFITGGLPGAFNSWLILTK